MIGVRSCKEALKKRNPRELKNLYLKENWQSRPSLNELAELAQAKNLKVQALSLKKINRLSDRESHQGALLEVEHSFDSKNFDWSFGKSSVVLVLDRIQDPKNLGAIIRTAWLMGVSAIFVSRRQSAGFTASVMKSASGGFEHVSIFIEKSLAPILQKLKQLNFWLYGLDSLSKKSLWSASLEGRQAFVLGSEGSGLKNSLKKQCDELLRIPQKDSSASYNVSVSAAIVLSESLRQRKGNV